MTTFPEEPKFSRFEINYNNSASLPIFPITNPSESGDLGVVMVGDYIAEAFVAFGLNIDPLFKEKWIILSTTQSDAVPTRCINVDFNFFTNEAGIKEYLESPASNIPYSTLLGDGHYVDPEVFYPNPYAEKLYDIIYPAKWFPTKNTMLLIEAAKLDPELNIAIYGWPVVSERKILESLSYRDAIIKSVSDLQNVQIFDLGLPTETDYHINPDGSVVIGSLSKEEMREKFYWKAKASIFLSEETEAVNRVCTEMLCCDIPMIITPTIGGLERLVNDSTGILIERTPQSIIEGVSFIKNNYKQFSPRSNFISNYGRTNANRILREIVVDLATRRNRKVNWNGFKDYGGDLWTSKLIYSKVFKF